MSNKLMYIIGGSVCALVFGIIVTVTVISTSNEEIRLRNTITQKQVDNTSEFDNMWKKISQVGQVAKADRESLMKLFNSYAQSRSSGSENQLMTWVHEAVPNVDSSTYKNLMNVITGSRDSWTMRQKEILQLKVLHDNLRMQWPGSWIVGDRPEIIVVIVTSDKTDDAFKSGKDNDTNLGL